MRPLSLYVVVVCCWLVCTPSVHVFAGLLLIPQLAYLCSCCAPFSEREADVSADPQPSSPPSYDKVMTAILQELKFLHMQSASQVELNKLACKDLPDGPAVMAFFVQGCSLGTQSERSLPQRRKQIE